MAAMLHCTAGCRMAAAAALDGSCCNAGCNDGCNAALQAAVLSSGRRSPWVRRRWECEAEDRWRRRAYGLGASAEERAGHLRAKVGLRGLLQSLARRGRLGGRLAPSGDHSRAPGLSPPMGIPAWRQGARELPAGTAEERDEEPVPPES